LIRTEETHLLSLLIGLWAKLRAKKKFALSDSIRDRPAKLGITLKDTAQDTIWT
jgi:cysteinyl-tRNA synthetase